MEYVVFFFASLLLKVERNLAGTNKNGGKLSCAGCEIVCGNEGAQATHNRTHYERQLTNSSAFSGTSDDGEDDDGDAFRARRWHAMHGMLSCIGATPKALVKRKITQGTWPGKARSNKESKRLPRLALEQPSRRR